MDFSQYKNAIDQLTFYDIVERTPIEKLTQISAQYENTIYIKRDDCQSVHSFKIRGAYNKLLQLTEDEKKRGVIAASAGNHAQGVAISAQKLGIEPTIVMPKTTPSIKVKSVESYGARTILHGDAYDDAYQHALTLSSNTNKVFIHPYDDQEVIVGQGTIAKEILDAIDQKIDYFFVPVGGGGLLAGILAYFKVASPSTKIIAVEPENSACLRHALDHGAPTPLDQVGIFADGVAVKQIGTLPFEIIKDHIDDTILVSTDEICASIKDIYDERRCIAEPAGALSLAGAKKYCQSKNIKNKTIMTILCGSNVNFDRLRYIAERAEIGEQKEAIFAVTIPEKKGSFLRFCNLLGHRSITEFNYRYSDTENATIFVGIELEDGEKDKLTIIDNLVTNGYSVTDLSDNEVAKLHIRYMVGGSSAKLSDEKLYRFQFPERPGALLQFLSTIGATWNISLFHYRNHGAAFGRVLAGIQVPDNDTAEFTDFLDQLGYTYFNESDNPAYRLFL